MPATIVAHHSHDARTANYGRAAEEGNTHTKEHVMTKSVRSFVVLVVFAMALTGLSLAQDETYHLRANIPFDFYAGNQLLPAGVYLMDVSYGTHVVALRNNDTGRTYSMVAVPANGAGSGQAVVEFYVAGNKHVLADLKTASTGVNFSENKRALATAQRTESVAIVATLR